MHVKFIINVFIQKTKIDYNCKIHVLMSELLCHMEINGL